MTPIRQLIQNQVLLATILLGMVLQGCAAKEEAKKDPSFEQWRDLAAKSKGHSPSSSPRIIDLPERKAEIVQEKIQEEEPERPLPTMLVTMAMRNTDVNVILRALARTGDQNIMMNDSVTGITNINVADTPWDQVFRAIMRTRGLTYKWEGDIIRVMTLEDMRHDRQIEQVITAQKTEKVEQKKVEPLITRVIPINYLSFHDSSGSGGTDSEGGGSSKGGDGGGGGGGESGGSLTDNLKDLLTKDGDGSPRGSIMLDSHTNALVVRASRDDIAEIIAVIEQLDKPTAQIHIEALIVETTRDAARELGIQWGGLLTGIDNKITHDLTGKHSATHNTADPTRTGAIGAAGEEISVPTIGNFPIKNTGGYGSMTLGLLAQKPGVFLLDVQLQALEAESKLNILSRPSITTLDNQTAVIESGTQVPVVTEGTGDEAATVEYQDATLSLEVTPHVIEESMVKLLLILKKDEVDFSRVVQGNPTIIKKTAKSDLILQDGETMVIGGLTKETSSGSDSGVPGLKDIPGLGYLFKGQGKSNQMEEVLIFLTPHILKKKEQPLEAERNG
jgi:type IV pilus assembly protein PilQ